MAHASCCSKVIIFGGYPGHILNFQSAKSDASSSSIRLRHFVFCANFCYLLYIVCCIKYPGDRSHDMLSSSLPNDGHYHTGDKWYASDHSEDVKHIPHVNDKSHVYCGSQFLPWETGRILEKHLTVLVKVFKANANYSFWMISHKYWEHY